MQSKEWLAYIGQKASEQMAALCALYGEAEDKDGQPLSTQAVLSLLSFEGVQPEIVVHYFRKKSHAAHIVRYGHLQLVMVSREPVPEELSRRAKRLKKELFSVKQQDTVDDKVRALLEEQVSQVMRELNALPVYVQVWTNLVPAEPAE
jgi:hypothetical protein